MYTEVENQHGEKIQVKVLETTAGHPVVVQEGNQVLSKNWLDGKFYPVNQ